MTGMARIAPEVSATLKKIVIVSVGPMAIGCAPAAVSGRRMKRSSGSTKSMESSVPITSAESTQISRVRSSRR